MGEGAATQPVCPLSRKQYAPMPGTPKPPKRGSGSLSSAHTPTASINAPPQTQRRPSAAGQSRRCPRSPKWPRAGLGQQVVPPRPGLISGP